ncbi:hypothetical protein LEP3755_66480 (plasmid) [Leptolyngbya sp. NIES-3755]|nr:hypothetical protein LEP3755_66480 [Leptolyngbya sp. NIES-3755]
MAGSGGSLSGVGAGLVGSEGRVLSPEGYPGIGAHPTQPALPPPVG